MALVQYFAENTAFFLLSVFLFGLLIGVTGFEPDPFGERGMRNEYVQFGYEFSDNVNYRVTKRHVETVQNTLLNLPGLSDGS